MSEIDHSAGQAGSLVICLHVEIDSEDDGRFIADIPGMPGVLAYGRTREEAIDAVTALALRVIADRIEHGEAGKSIKEPAA